MIPTFRGATPAAVRRATTLRTTATSAMFLKLWCKGHVSGHVAQVTKVLIQVV
jgi:hypothetical protein